VARLLRMPEVSAGGEGAVLVGWLVEESVPFAALDAIATIETDKAIVDLPADSAGIILKTLVSAGAEVAVGDPIAVLGEPGESDADMAELLAGLQPATQLFDASAPDVPVVAASSQFLSDGVSATESPRRIFSSPLARRMAKEAELDLAEIEATGPGGRVVRRDVLGAIASGPVVAPEPTRAVSLTRLAAPSSSGPADAAGYDDVPHTRMRRAIARRLTQSVQEAPAFSIRSGARVDALIRLRSELNANGRIKVSLNDLVVAAVGRTHRDVPEMNVIWMPDAVRSFERVDVSVAVATEHGLLTPVLRGVESMTISALAAANADLVERARAGRIRQDELEGGSITVTNLGPFGTEDFTAIINPPQSAILAVGAAAQAAVVVEGRLEVRTVMNVTLTVDHRPIDGAVAARWMAAFLAMVEAPAQILA
jgi:pyruvate dehydrogenase E2 component (dihydrolipoamide acetyltransferase)